MFSDISESLDMIHMLCCGRDKVLYIYIHRPKVVGGQFLEIVLFHNFLDHSKIICVMAFKTCILSFITVVLFHVGLVGQTIGNFKPLQIEGLTPKWIHYSFDSTIVGHEMINPRDDGAGFDGYGHVYLQIPGPPIIKDGFWYKVNNTDYDADISGGLIEKIDLNTGKRIWYRTFDRRTQSYRESVHHAEIIGDQLWVYTLRITRDDPVHPIPVISFFEAPGVLKIRKYDLKTGDLTEVKEPNIEDKNVRVFRSGFNNETLIRQINTTTLRTVEHRMNKSALGGYIVIDTINHDGIRQNPSDTIFSKFRTYNWGPSVWNSKYKLWIDHDGALYWLDFYCPTEKSTDQPGCFLRIWTKDGKYREIDLSPLNTLNDIKIWDFLDLKNGKILLSIYRKDETSRFIVIDEMTGQRYQDALNPGIFFEAPLTNDGSVLTMNYDRGDKEGDNIWALDFFALDNFEHKKISTFRLKDPGYFLVPSNVAHLANGDFLLSFFYTESWKSTFKGRFMTDIRVSPEMINFASGITNKNQAVKFLISPNPASSNILLKNIPISDSYVIYGINGQMVKTGIVKSEIDIENFSQGLYFIHLIKDDVIVGYSGLFVKI